jgi:hypothetical protein
MQVNYLAAMTAIVAVSSVAIGCSRKSDTSASASAITPVRGKLVSMSDSILTVTTANGEVRVALVQPVHVYTRQPAQLARVTDGSFVGVTSVPGPDGAQRATEIHLFPEELRGTGEGSYLMGQQGGEGNARMSNGTVAASRMTNGAASRMTNGAAGGQSGGKLTVNYNGGSQAITIPPDVAVTAIVPTQTKLAPGEDVVALADKQPDGTLRASRVILVGSGS